MENRKSSDKAQRILLAAGRLIATCGCEETTIEAIAREAKMSRGLLHYYFRDKEELISKVGQVMRERVITRVQQLFKGNSPEELVDNLYRFLRELITTDRDFYRFNQEFWVQAQKSKKIHKKLNELNSESMKRLWESIDDAKAAGLIRKDLSTRGLASFLITLSIGYANQMILSEEVLNDQEVWDTAREALLNLIQNK